MEVIRSIRYANACRFARAEVEPGVKVAPVAVCPQRESRLGGVMGPMMTDNPLSEDCLRLSIFTPSREGNYPVMVWFCGGAFITGSGEFARYDASRLCEEGNIVVVNVSYRVGALGFLYLPGRGAINLGIEDQICALKWISKHISEFGGDPQRVTLCGQSAGAYSIACIIGRGNCSSLFNKAIFFSAPFSLANTPSVAQHYKRHFRYFLEKQGATLDTANFHQILEAQKRFTEWAQSPVPFCPVSERIYPPKDVDLSYLKEVMLCYQKNDAQPFVHSRLLSWIGTIACFKAPLRKYACMLRCHGVKNVNKIRFTWHPKNGKIGACHTLEVPFLLGDWESWNKAPMLGSITREEFEARGKEFRKTIADFVSR